jgi:prolyl-tRNA synthetase
MVRRASRAKAPVDLAGIVVTVRSALDAEQAALLGEATTRRDARTTDVDSLDDARAAAETGWARIAWDLVGTEGEAELATSGVTVRCLTRADGSVPESQSEPDLTAYVSRAY